MSPAWIMIGARITKLMNAPSRHAGGHRDAHQAADAEHRGVERQAQPELPDVGAEDRRYHKFALAAAA